MFVCIPQTCLTIRQVNHCKPKLLSILHSSSMIFSSTLWIELTTVWGSGYTHFCELILTKGTRLSPHQDFFLLFFFLLHLFYNIPYQGFVLIVCWQSQSTNNISVRNKPEVESFFLKWGICFGKGGKEEIGEFTFKKKKKWTLKLESELPKVLK